MVISLTRIGSLKIKIITTGGTIDKIYFDQKSQFQVGEPQISEMLQEANVTFDYEVQSLLRKDSLDLTDEDRQLIYETVKADNHRHILITHGTDTLLLTAQVLQQIPDKVIVLTGSMQPARLRFNDAIFNIGYAMAAIQLLPKNVKLNRFEEL
jgi:L-asparaginase